jgi:predicted DNA-binding transcriptional regulator YafY
MRYSRAERLIQLALEMQSTRGGLTLAEIEEKFDVSRRTAIRMRDAVLRAFPQAIEVPTGDRTKRWRLPTGSAQTFADLTAEDLAVLETAAMAMKQANLPGHADNLQMLGSKVRNMLAADRLRHIDPDLEALTEAEGIAHRAGPRPFIPHSSFEALRTAIKSCRLVTFRYISRSDGLSTERKVAPLGFLYGHRHYLVAYEVGQAKPKFFSLSAISKIKILPDAFERDPAFNLKELVSQSFGVFEEQASDIVWRFSAEAAPTARQYLFHHSQQFEDADNGELIVRFRAGGLLEMAWHLLQWGDHVEVLEPAELKRLMPEPRLSWPALP